MSTPPGKTVLDQFAECWEGLEDPRTGNAGLHDFHELLMIALCTVLCGGQSAVDMGLFARAKEPFLRGFLTLACQSALNSFQITAPKSFQFVRRTSAVFSAA